MDTNLTDRLFNWIRSLIISLNAALLCAALLVPLSARAATITFYAADQNVWWADNEDRTDFIWGCYPSFFGSGFCEIQLLPPTGGSFLVSSDISRYPQGIQITAPNAVELSKGLLWDEWSDRSVAIVLGYIGSLSPPPSPCAQVNCQITEDGTVQKLGTFTWSDGTVDTILFQSSDTEPVTSVTISLNFDGKVRDRVGQGEFAPNSDGQLDGVFTVLLNTGSGNRTVTRLDLVRNNGDGIWNTNPGDGFWILGAATNETAQLYNAANDSVNFSVSEGGTFKIFAADLQNRLFIPGSTFVLTASFVDGTTAAASVTIPSANGAPTLAYNGPLRDRVGQDNHFQGSDGHLDPTFTISFPAGGNTRTVTSLRLDSSNGGVWDTNSATGFWTLGAATNLDAPLYNAGNDAVSFPISPGGNFLIFASDWFFGAPFPNGLFQPGDQFTLSITFSDGNSATATTTIPGNNDVINLAYNGPLQDRVADDNRSVRADGFLDPTFTVTFLAGGITRTVTSLRLDSSDGGVWDTSSATGFWTLAAATNLQSPSYNAADDSVNFVVPAGGTFMIFASDWFRGPPFPNGLFQKGKGFNLTIGFNDGSAATANTVIP